MKNRCTNLCKFLLLLQKNGNVGENPQQWALLDVGSSKQPDGIFSQSPGGSRKPYFRCSNENKPVSRLQKEIRTVAEDETYSRSAHWPLIFFYFLIHINRLPGDASSEVEGKFMASLKCHVRHVNMPIKVTRLVIIPDTFQPVLGMAWIPLVILLVLAATTWQALWARQPWRKGF